MSARDDEAVQFWAPYFQEIRAQKGLTEEQYPLALCLAFTDVESDGRPNVRRTNKNGKLSKYVGLLQIGTENAADAAIQPGWPTRNDPKFGVIWNHFELETLPPLEAGRRSIEHFFYYLERYKRIHDYDPELIALIWKAGPGFTRKYKASRAKDLAQSELFLESRWGGTPKKYRDDFVRDLRYWRSKNLANVTTTGALPPSSAGASAAYATLGAASSAPVKRNALGKIIIPAGAAAPPGCTAVGDTRTPLRAPGATGAGDPQRTAAARSAQRIKRKALDHLSRSFYDSLRVYREGAYVRWRTNNGYSERDYRQIKAFVETAEGGGYEATLEAVFRDAVTTWVKPLVDPVVGNSPWGKKRDFPARSRSPGEARQVLRDPESGETLYRRHFGVDYATLRNGLGKNQPCYAIADGEVIRAGKSLSYGLVIYLLHANGVTSRYAHLSELRVKRGDAVSVGDVIGITGASEGTRYGNKKGWYVQHNKITPHLHFELRVNKGVFTEGKASGGYRSNTANISIDPEPIFAVCPNPGEVRPTLDPRLEAALGMRSEASALVASAQSSEVLLEASRVYDEASGVLRDTGLALLGRAAFWKAQDENAARDVQRNTKFDVPVE